VETRLAELFSRARASSTERWTTRQAHELACALVIAGSSFYVRRVLQQLERGEIDVVTATCRIEHAHAAGVSRRFATVRIAAFG
jgi:hypothetical protein